MQDYGRCVAHQLYDHKQQSHLPVRQVRAVRPDLAEQSLHIHCQRVDGLGFGCDYTQGSDCRTALVLFCLESLDVMVILNSRAM